MSDGEVVFEQDGYTVVDSSVGRLYLKKNGQELAWCWHDSPNAKDFPNWIVKWEKNARNQIENLEDRIDELKRKQERFRTLLGD
jgi:hypothetical protein